MSNPACHSDQVSYKTILSYSLPVPAIYLLLGPTYNIVPALYAKNFGLSLASVAAIIFYTRIIDAIADPLIGVMADRHRMRGGSRKIWVACGAGALAGSAYGLFVPFVTGSALYFLIFNVAFFISYSLIEIPHVTWGGEISRDGRSRSNIFGARSTAIFIGFALWSSFPLLPFFQSQEFSPETIESIAICGGFLVILLTAISLLATPNGVSPVRRHPSLRASLLSVGGNRPLQILLGSYLFCALALGMWQGILFIYLDSYLELGRYFAAMQLISNIAGLAAIPAWRLLLNHLEKSTVWIITLIVFTAATATFAFIDPSLPWYAALLPMAIIHTCFSAQYMLIPGLLSDISDYGELKFRQNRGATYFALWNLLSKVGFGVGSGIALAIAAFYLVDPAKDTQDANSISGLLISFVYLPCVLALVSCIGVYFMPIDRCRHAVVARRLARRRESSNL